MTRSLYLAMLALGCSGSKSPQTTDATAAAVDEAAEVVLTVDERVARAAALLTTGKDADAELAVAELEPLLVTAPDRAWRSAPTRPHRKRTQTET